MNARAQAAIPESYACPRPRAPPYSGDGPRARALRRVRPAGMVAPPAPTIGRRSGYRGYLFALAHLPADRPFPSRRLATDAQNAGLKTAPDGLPPAARPVIVGAWKPTPLVRSSCCRLFGGSFRPPG